MKTEERAGWTTWFWSLSLITMFCLGAMTGGAPAGAAALGMGSVLTASLLVWFIRLAYLAGTRR